MTQVERPRLKSELRWGQVYGWDVLDHEQWMAGRYLPVRNDYVGQTRQKGRARENQHRDDKPWADLTVGSPRVLWEGWCTDEELDEWERHFIQDVPFEQRPRLNWKLNEHNSRQIPIPRQEEQRWARDDREGRPRWSATPYRPEAYGYRPAPAVQVKRKSWRPWQKRLLGWSIAWAVLTVGLWVVEARVPADVPWWSVPAAVAATLGLLCVWANASYPLPKRKKRRRRRR